MSMKWTLTAVAIIALMGMGRWLQHGTIERAKQTLKEANEALTKVTAEKDKLAGRLEAYGEVNAELDRWKAGQDAKNNKFLGDLRTALKDDKCARQPVPPDVLRMQYDRTVEVRTRAGVHTPAE